MSLHLAATAARRMGLGGLAEASKIVAARLPIRYRSRRNGLRFYGAWKHRGHLRAMAQGQIEPLTLARFTAELRTGATVFDVGAYLGLYTLTAAQRVGPAGRVISIEPDPAAFRHLARSVAHNGFTARVELVHAAAAAQTGEVFLYQDGHGPSTSTTVTGAGMSVPALRLDDLDVTPSVVKIDVEGAEPAVLRGFNGLGAVDDLIVECNPGALLLGGHTPADLVAYIRRAGLNHILVIDEFEQRLMPWPELTGSLFTNLHCRRR